jgi:hypothetical protein
LPLDQGVIEERVLQIHKEVAIGGKLPKLVGLWADKTLARPLSSQTTLNIVNELNKLNLDIATLTSGTETTAVNKLAPFIAAAYSRHAPAADGVDHVDPAALTSPQASISAWDFQVETFDEAETQGVIRENIRAAGALDYVYNLGELLNVFKLTDVLVLRWAAGLVDIEDQVTSSKLYRYWQLRETRVSPEDKLMLYKRVLNKGDAELLSRMVVNESFPPLWHSLMEKATDYIQVATEAAEGKVSRVPIERATQELQYNLSEHMVGMAHMQVTDMYMQLRDAFEILGSRDIVNQLTAGRRRTLWAVIERLSKEELGAAPDAGALRTMAVEGNQVFQWIGDFDKGTYDDSQFQRFVDAAEAWIIAAASGAGEAKPAEEAEEEDEFDEFAEFEDEEDPGSDW